MKPDILIVIPLNAEGLAMFAERFTVHYVPERQRHLAEAGAIGNIARGVVSNGTIGWNAEQIAAMPALEIICAQGAGYEGIDVAAAQQRGIVVTHSPGANASCVADHAMALLCSAVRGVAESDRSIRAGGWIRELMPSLAQKKLGILGFGHIGKQLARRAAGFDMEIGYHGRRPQPDVAHRYFSSPAALAEWADFFIVACPGGPATRKMVNADVLAALGPQGYLVNIARGSIVDTAALVAALHAGTLGGAALDTFENEPGVPPELLDTPRTVLTSHMGGRSPDSNRAMLAMVADNLSAHFSGKPPLTPVGGTAE